MNTSISDSRVFFAPGTQGKDERAIGGAERGASGGRMMPVICQWCGVSLPPVPARGSVGISHGMCQLCADQFMAEAQAQAPTMPCKCPVCLETFARVPCPAQLVGAVTVELCPSCKGASAQELAEMEAGR